MRRTYLRSLSMAAVIGCTAVVMPAAQSARGLFDSKAVQQNRFAVLAQPVGASNWKLLVLEQIKQRPRCWTAKADGLVDPTLNTSTLPESAAVISTAMAIHFGAVVKILAAASG